MIDGTILFCCLLKIEIENHRPCLEQLVEHA